MKRQSKLTLTVQRRVREVAVNRLTAILYYSHGQEGIFLLKLSKVKSATPGLSVAVERYQYHLELKSVVWRAELFLQMTFDSGDITKRMGNYGYSPINERLPTTAQLVHLPVPKYGQELCSLGLCHTEAWEILEHRFFLSKGRLDKEEKVQFYTHVLPCHLSPHPDNMPQHRQQTPEIASAISAAGSFIAWNHPQSPDLNLIEKFWDVVSSRITQLHLELLTGEYGVRRCADVDDLIFCLETTRMSRHWVRLASPKQLWDSHF
ncbi:hypothetical protein Pelo_10123 [Pelomyxa schiedti]|nr:hypothetical protein Pelo_10123 [Pelomyxa schiedti]